VSELSCIDRELVHLAHYTWVDIRRFRILDAASGDTVLLAALIQHPQYRDDYLGKGLEAAADGERHGPYWLSAIGPEAFQPIQADDGRLLLQRWADESVSHAISMYDSAIEHGIRPADPRPSPEVFQERLDARVYPCLVGDIVQLPDMRDQAEHDYGWILGLQGFHEFLAIDREAGTLTLVVATDD
jgi:hypothetical protein